MTKPWNQPIPVIARALGTAGMTCRPRSGRSHLCGFFSLVQTSPRKSAGPCHLSLKVSVEKQSVHMSLISGMFLPKWPWFETRCSGEWRIISGSKSVTLLEWQRGRGLHPLCPCTSVYTVLSVNSENQRIKTLMCTCVYAYTRIEDSENSYIIHF